MKRPPPRPPARSKPQRGRTAKDAGGRRDRARADRHASAAKADDRSKGSAEEYPAAIVAVGASAGGLEAFSAVLEQLGSTPDIAFIFVQHLSPQHSSALPELLAAKTPLKVVQAGSGMRIETNHIYVIPPNVHLEILDGELHLVPRPTDRTQFTPIDFFFQSLARWAQDRAIGVILSGTASDGAAGIREIKALGGITIAQRPDTARHDGMPRAAIATGLVDLVLNPREIAEHLGHVRSHPYLLRSSVPEADDDVAVADGHLREIFVMLRRASGIDFKQYKIPTVRRRLLRRMALLRLTDADSYVRYLAENTAEAKALSQDLLIHVTRFFRDPDSFGVLEAQVLPDLLRDRGDDPIRIWVPGCATGEEAYSVAISLLESIGDRTTERRIQIFATDVSDTAIEQARTGTYPVSIAADVSSERLRRFFTKSDGGFRVVKSLRDMCVFARHDLTRDPPFSRLDLIVCRNVLIYLDTPLQKRLISVFHYALKARGFLMLGPAETTGPVSFFTVADKKWRLFRKAQAEVALPLTFPPEPPVPGGRHGATAQGRRHSVPEGKSVQDEATRLILDRYGPPGVIVDANLDIVQFRGHTGPYLEAAAGEPNLNVLKMARGGLLHPLRTALQTARRRARVVRKERVQVQRNGDWMEIALEVVPVATSRGDHFLVLFDETPPAATRTIKRGKAMARASQKADSDSRVIDLRRELAASREYLQSIIQELEAANEELQSANEEILSSNEELQSTNEELDTAKEELQSTNEELNTVNEELHSRNDELTRVNSDLVNLLGSVDIPIVIVGSDLGIRRFTPKAEQLFNLIPGDIGRPIGQINPNFEVDDLEGLIRETIEHVAPREREVRDKTNRWQSLRVRPYKGVDNRLDGAVLAVIDIDAAKRYDAAAETAREHIRTLVDTVAQPVVVLDDDGRVRAANRRFQKLAGATETDLHGRRLADAGGTWASAPWLSLIEAARTNGDATEHALTDGGKKARPRLTAMARRIRLDDSASGTLVTIMERAGADDPG
jgi:two-component system CheB/CheR fusion protein